MEQRIIDTSEITILQTEYVNIKKVLKCFIELIALGIDKTVIEDCMKCIFRPSYIISTQNITKE